MGQTEHPEMDQVRRQAAAINQLTGAGNELYQYSKPLVEAL